MTRPAAKDRQRKSTMNSHKTMVMARITTETSPLLSMCKCSCGWEKFHKRKQVCEDAAERHVKKRHLGQAIWM